MSLKCGRKDINKVEHFISESEKRSVENWDKKIVTYGTLYQYFFLVLFLDATDYDDMVLFVNEDPVFFSWIDCGPLNPEEFTCVSTPISFGHD